MSKTLKKTLSIIIAILMIVTTVPFAFAAEGHTHALTADGETVEFTELPADITGISTEANYYLTEDIELTKALNINLEGTVNLCLNGHSITTTAKTSNSTVIFLSSGTLNLCDCQDGGYITSSEDLSLSGVFVANDSEFNMYSGEFKGLSSGFIGNANINMYGGKISGCRVGVSNVGSFNMYGGEISGCDTAVSLQSTTHEFTMHGGKIINNESSSSSASVNIEKGTFTMNSGEISGNQASSFGTVRVHSNGSFIMNGGKISDNVGYGVNNYGSITITAGEISGNTAAGIFADKNSALTLKGGKITNNVGGINAVNYVTAYLAGDGVQITGNENYDVSKYISFEVSEQLTPEKTQIGISASGNAFASPDGTNITTLEGMEACFYSTDDVFQVVECDNGELYLIYSYPYIYENKNGDYVVVTPFIEGIAFKWYEDSKLLENETSATLSKDKIQPGNKYICSVCVDGIIEAELEKECPSLITHQPTAGEPYVEVNDDTDATYQWYTVERIEAEVTDENADARETDEGEYASYDAETGWTGAFTGDYYDGGYEAKFFKVELEAGQTITLQADKEVGLIGIWAEEAEDWEDFYPDGTEAVSFTASYDDVYNVYACLEEGTHIRAYIGEATYIAIDGETAAELMNPEFGKKYVCEVTYGDGKKEKTDAFEYIYAITHQPTEAEPYVEINDNTDASYQWYTVEGDRAEITDKNASGDWRSLGAPFNNSVYEDGKWIADNLGDIQYYFIVSLEAGDTINFEFASEVEAIIFGIDGDFSGQFEVGDTKYSITVEEAGTYWLVTPPVDYVRAYTGSRTYTAIDDATAAELKNPEFGKKYACEVTFKDGTKEMSDVLEYVYAITHQPTSAEPYVELNDNTDASYQWYTVEECITEITNQNASTVSYDWGESSYDKETGWTGVPDEEDSYGQDFFTVELEAGETLTVEVTGDFADGVGLYDYNTDADIWLDAESGKTTYELTATVDGNYTFYTYVNSGIVTVKAYLDEITYAAIDDETGATLANPVIGNEYACEVTFKDGTTEMSDTFEVTKLHDCDFSGEWEYDSDEHWKECAVENCDEISEDAGHDWSDRNGICTVCEYECEHSYGEGVLTRPTFESLVPGIAGGGWLDGYYTYTCSICEHYYHEAVKRANYTAFDTAVEELEELLAREDLFDYQKQTYTSSLNNVLNGVRYDRIETEQDTVNRGTQNINNYISEITAGIENGTMIKADWSKMEALFDAINDLFGSVTDKIISSKSDLYSETLNYYNYCSNDPSFSQKDYDDNIIYEKNLETLLAGLEDGTMLKADYTAIDEAIADIDVALKNATISEEMADELADIKADLAELKADVNTSVADLVNSGLLDRAEAITETMDNCANGTHSFTNYETTEEAKCGVAGKEEATCDNGCGATDENAITALEHVDKDGDYECDYGCGHEFEKPVDPTPDTPDEPTDNNCDHLCHKSGFVGFIWKIVRFLYKFFNIQQYCDCGVLHYDNPVFG